MKNNSLLDLCNSFPDFIAAILGRLKNIWFKNEADLHLRDGRVE
jgi:hypothetical protein